VEENSAPRRDEWEVSGWETILKVLKPVSPTERSNKKIKKGDCRVEVFARGHSAWVGGMVTSCQKANRDRERKKKNSTRLGFDTGISSRPLEGDDLGRGRMEISSSKSVARQGPGERLVLVKQKVNYEARAVQCH